MYVTDLEVIIGIRGRGIFSALSRWSLIHPFRCPNCLAEITFTTDLENCDYRAEHGATRLFDAFKYYQEQAKTEEDKDAAEKTDAMKMLEKRTKMSRAEMDAMGKILCIQSSDAGRGEGPAPPP
jgi:hypothetical protein